MFIIEYQNPYKFCGRVIYFTDLYGYSNARGIYSNEIKLPTQHKTFAIVKVSEVEVGVAHHGLSWTKVANI